MTSMKEFTDQLYQRARAAETTVDILQTRLNVMRGVALVGWVLMLLTLIGVIK